MTPVTAYNLEKDKSTVKSSAITTMGINTSPRAQSLKTKSNQHEGCVSNISQHEENNGRRTGYPGVPSENEITHKVSKWVRLITQ